MIYMLCRNKVRNYEEWRTVFDSNASAPHKAGLSLVHLWRSLDDAHTVFFLFEVHDLERAKAFISAPEGAKIGKEQVSSRARYVFWKRLMVSNSADRQRS